MKKILFIHHWSTIGGAGISLYNTWKSLEKYYDLKVYIPEKPNDLNQFFLDKGFKPNIYPFSSAQISYYSGGNSLYKPGFWIYFFKIPFQVLYWKKIIKDENPDLIIVNSKVLVWMAPLFKGRRSFCFVRETIKGNPGSIVNLIIKKLLDKFTVVSFLSNYDLKQTNLKQSKTLVAEDFLYENEYLDILGKEEACKRLNIDNQYNVSFVGGLNKLKGLDVSIKAFKHLKNENINLLVAGIDIKKIIVKSEYHNCFNVRQFLKVRRAKKILKLIDDNDLKDKIHFLGVFKDISLLYSASDILVFPMINAHQARPAFEIGVQKKPAIISDFPNIKEFIINEVNGLTFNHKKPYDLSCAILSLKNDSEFSNRLGLMNYKFTLEYHTEEYVMKKIINKIDEIIQGETKNV
jgi:glycosyltransferase involved in cell wall biosynthesis